MSRLLPSQIEMLWSIVEQSGFARSQFNLLERPSRTDSRGRVHELKYTGTDFYFAFEIAYIPRGKGAVGECVHFSPGANSLLVRRGTWNGIMLSLQWVPERLACLKREVEVLGRLGAVSTSSPTTKTALVGSIDDEAPLMVCRRPVVFISYSSDSARHGDAVHALAEQLRQKGIDAVIDRYQPHPAQGWPRWMLDQIQQSDFVLCICTAVYKERFENQEPSEEGRGARFEGSVITQAVYEKAGRNEKFIPVLLSAGSKSDVPKLLAPFTYYTLPEEFDKLYCHLTSQPYYEKSELRPLEERTPISPKAPGEKLGGSKESGPNAADKKTLRGLRAVLPSSVIAALRAQQIWHTFKWPFAKVLADFKVWEISPDHRFLAPELEDIHRKLRERACALWDGVLRYSTELPGQEQISEVERVRGFLPLVGNSVDVPERDERRNEMWQAKEDLCDLYEQLLLAGHRRFVGIEVPQNISAVIEHSAGLEFVNWFGSSGTHLPAHWPTALDHPVWICVRNKSGNVADNVSASIEFVNSAKSRCPRVPEAVWWEIGGKTPSGNDRVPHAQHTISIREGDEQYFLLWAKDGENHVTPYKDANEPLEPLERDAWEARIAVLSDNVAGFEIVLNLSVTRDGGSSRAPFIARQQALPSRLTS
jgi:hypothetical protein